MDQAHTERKSLDHRLLRIAAGGHPVECAEEGFGLAPHHMFEQVVLGGKAPVDGAAADPGAGGDVFDIGATDAVGLEDGSGGLQDGAVEGASRFGGSGNHW